MLLFMIDLLRRRPWQSVFSLAAIVIHQSTEVLFCLPAGLTLYRSKVFCECGKKEWFEHAQVPDERRERISATGTKFNATPEPLHQVHTNNQNKEKACWILFPQGFTTLLSFKCAIFSKKLLLSSLSPHRHFPPRACKLKNNHRYYPSLLMNRFKSKCQVQQREVLVTGGGVGGWGGCLCCLIGLLSIRLPPLPCPRCQTAAAAAARLHSQRPLCTRLTSPRCEEDDAGMCFSTLSVVNHFLYLFCMASSLIFFVKDGIKWLLGFYSLFFFFLVCAKALFTLFFSKFPTSEIFRWCNFNKSHCVHLHLMQTHVALKNIPTAYPGLLCLRFPSFPFFGFF